jgi:hypothetical protein
VALGLAEASALAAALAEGLKSSGTTSDQGGEGLRKAVQQGLKMFDEEYGPAVGGDVRMIVYILAGCHTFTRDSFGAVKKARASALAIPAVPHWMQYR